MLIWKQQDRFYLIYSGHLDFMNVEGKSTTYCSFM